jgi:hypothetical protein
MTVGRIARELWWMSQEFTQSASSSPWLSTFTYHMADEQ